MYVHSILFVYLCNNENQNGQNMEMKERKVLTEKELEQVSGGFGVGIPSMEAICGSKRDKASCEEYDSCMWTGTACIVNPNPGRSSKRTVF